MALRAATISVVFVLCVPLALASDARVVPEPPQFYAYVSDTEFAVMHGIEVRGRAAAKRMVRQNVTWTLDNRFASVLSPDDEQEDENDMSSNSLVVIDAYTGNTRRLPCFSCREVAPMGGSTLLARRKDRYGSDTFLRFDLETDRPPVSMQLGDKIDGTNFLFAGTSGRSLMLNITTDDVEKILGVSTAGDAVVMGVRHDQGPQRSSTSWRSFGGGIVGTLGADGIVAINESVVNSGDMKDCRRTGSIYIMTQDGEEYLLTDFADAAPPGTIAGIDAFVAPHDMWIGRDGYLYATVGAAKCEQGQSDSDLEMTSWRFEAGRWVRTATGVVRFRELLNGATLTINDQSDLLYTYGSRSVKVADNVWDVEVRPSEQSHQLRAASNESGCFLGAETKLGVRSGDIDGDGGADEVSAAVCQSLHGPGDGDPSGVPGRDFVLRVKLATGEERVQRIRQYADDNARWLGLSDVNGDGRLEVLLTEHELGKNGVSITLLVYRDGEFQTIPGELSRELALKGSYSESAGFQCRQQKDGRGEILLWSRTLDDLASPPLVSIQERLYAADSSGQFHLKSTHQRTRKATADELSSGLWREGLRPDCPGL